MAIYHFSVQVIKRSEGRSATSAAAYRAGEKIKDERLNQSFNYEKKEVADNFILAPDDSPEWIFDRSILWNEVEKIEKRKDAQLAREINIALPVELSFEEQKKLIQDYVYDQFVSKGMVADCAIHLDNKDNPHAHVMLAMREISEDGFGKKNRDWNDKKLLEQWREEWANYANESLKAKGVEETIDHRSYEKQGVEKIPQKHESIHTRALEKKGVKTEVRKYNDEVKKINQTIVQLNEEIEETKKQVAIALDEAKQEVDQQDKIDQILLAAKNKKADVQEKDLQSTAYRLKLQEERDNLTYDLRQIEKGMKKINSVFKELQEIPKTIKEQQKQLDDLKRKSVVSKVFKRKEYKESKNKIQSEIWANSDRLHALKEKLPDLYEQQVNLQNKKLELQERQSSLNREINKGLYQTRSKQKVNDLEK